MNVILQNARRQFARLPRSLQAIIVAFLLLHLSGFGFGVLLWTIAVCVHYPALLLTVPALAVPAFLFRQRRRTPHVLPPAPKSLRP